MEDKFINEESLRNEERERRSRKKTNKESQERIRQNTTTLFYSV